MELLPVEQYYPLAAPRRPMPARGVTSPPWLHDSRETVGDSQRTLDAMRVKEPLL